MRRFLAVASLLGALTLVPRRASADALTVDDVLVSTRNHHPGLQAARTATDRADAQAVAAEGAFDPRIKARGVDTLTGYYDQTVVDAEARVLTPLFGLSAFTGWRLGTGKFASYDDKSRTLDLGEVRAGLELPLLQGFSIDKPRADRRKAQIARELAKAEIRGRELDILRAASIAYWDWVAAGERLRIRETQLALAVERGRQIQQSVDAGQRPPVDLVDNERLIASRDALTVATRRDFQRTSFDLSIYLRDPAGKPVVAADTARPALPAPPAAFDLEVDVDRAIRQAIARAPQLGELTQRREIAATDAALARNQILPQLNVSALAIRGLGPSDPTLPDRDQLNLAAGVTFEVPIGMHAARGALGMAEAEQRRLALETQLVRDRLEAEVRAVHAELAAARARLTLALRTAELSEQLATAERTRFSRGDSTVVLVNIREEAAADAAASAVDAHTEVFRARARYLTLLGELPR